MKHYIALFFAALMVVATSACGYPQPIPEAPAMNGGSGEDRPNIGGPARGVTVIDLPGGGQKVTICCMPPEPGEPVPAH